MWNANENDTDEEEFTLFDKLKGGKPIMMVKHEPGFIIIMVLNTIVFLATLFFNLELQPMPNIQIQGLFVNGFLNISDTYQLEITPPVWMFSVWSAVYAWQLVWIIYSLVSIFRKTSEGPVYLCPVLLPRYLFFLFILGLGFNIGWLFLWDRHYISVAFILIILMTFTLFGALALSYKTLVQKTYLLKSLGRRADIWVIRILVQNGIAFFATWTTFVALFDLGAMLSYAAIPKLDVSVSSTIILGLASGFVVLYFLFDIFLLDKYSRYTLSPYMAEIIILSGVFLSAWKTSTVNAIFSLTLLATSCTLTMIKMFFICLREISAPKEKESAILKELDETRRLLK